MMRGRATQRAVAVCVSEPASLTQTDSNAIISPVKKLDKRRYRYYILYIRKPDGGNAANPARSERKQR